MRGSRARGLVVALATLLTLGPAIALGAVAALAGAGPAGADPPPGFATVLVQGNLLAGPGGGPTSFAYAPDGRVFVGRKTGVVDVWDHGVEHTFVDLRDEVNTVQSRGLVGMVLDPNFATNPRVYVLFTQELRPDDPDQGYPAGGKLISIKPMATDPDTADPATRVTLVSGFKSPSRLHSVAGLRFDDQGHLLVGFADGSDNGVNQGQSLVAENIDDLRGKILRIDPTTGAGIPGNPFYDSGSPMSVRSRVYAYGLRNPFRFTVDPSNDDVYVGEVGWNTWEQLDVFRPTFSNPRHDRNGGWPCYEGGEVANHGVALVQPDYQTSPETASTCHAIYPPSEGGTGVGAIDPLYSYRHDEVPHEVGSAIVGGPKYTGTSNYPSQYVGKLFVGDFARDSMRVVDPATGAWSDFGTSGTWGSPVDMQIAPDGNVAWLGIASGQLREIVYTGSTNHPPVAHAGANITTSPTVPMTVKFSSAGTSDADGDSLTYHWDFGDGKTSTQANPQHVYKKAGGYQVTLTVSDGHPGGVATANLQIGAADAFPTVSYITPNPRARFEIGDTIHVTLAANDAEDGPLSGDSVQTTIVEHTGGHAFPGGDFSGTSGSFQFADLGFDDTYYELDTTVTDSSGLETSITTNVLPKTVPVTVASQPAGATVTVDGIAHATPFTWDPIVGSEHEVVAPSTASFGGATGTFSTWTSPSGVDADTFASFVVPDAATTVAARYDSIADGFAVSDASIVEGDSGLRDVAVTISRSVASSTTTSVQWKTVAGSAVAADFVKASGTATFAPGQTSKDVLIGVHGDTKAEPDEQFGVKLTNPIGGSIVQPVGTVTILDDDPGSGSLHADVGDVTVLEGGAATRSAAFTVSLSAPSPGGVTVGYATADGTAKAGTDYTATAGTLTFAAGQVSQTVDVPVKGDRNSETTESFTLALSKPVGAALGRATGTGYVATDDSQVVLSISSGNYYEGDRGKPKIPFTVSIGTPSTDPVSVTWTVNNLTTSSSDVKLASGVATIPAGSLDTTVEVTTIADTVHESNESFDVTLANPVGATIGTGTGLEIVRDDDPGTPSNRAGIGDVQIVEGQNGTRAARFVVTLATAQANTVSMHYATADGTATAGADYRARSGTVTFPPAAVARVVSIPIVGDTVAEASELFTVTLSSPSGTTIADGTGRCTITDDD
ncbi:MAG TPA: Calx-beta domain-containing protein [Acidimicrobiia bacterium]|nr:Calx-beta domain-containing protein [Acidimicrobiia bacterium]